MSQPTHPPVSTPMREAIDVLYLAPDGLRANPPLSPGKRQLVEWIERQPDRALAINARGQAMWRDVADRPPGPARLIVSLIAKRVLIAREPGQ